jgi:hypothetical protein
MERVIEFELRVIGGSRFLGVMVASRVDGRYEMSATRGVDGLGSPVGIERFALFALPLING